MRRLLYIGVIAFCVSLLTGVTQVQPGEVGVVRRFGKLLDTRLEPGLHIGLPWGMDRVDRVQVAFERRVTVGFSGEEERDVTDTIPSGQLVTGDHNLVNVQVQIDYTVDPKQVDRYVLNRDLVGTLLGRTAESCLAEWVAGRNVDFILSRGPSLLPSWLAAELKARLAPYELGIQIGQVGVAPPAPPNEVKNAFYEVARAATDNQTRVNQAQQDRQRRMSSAQGDAFHIRSLAAAYANEQDLLAKAEAATFETRLEQYHRLRRENTNYLAGIWWDEMSRLYARMRANGRIDLLDHHLNGEGLNITQMPLLPKKK